MPKPIPDKFAISWLVGRLHVSEGDDAVIEEITRRIPKDVTPSVREAMVEYALDEHHANQRLYYDVVRGNL